MIHFEGGRNPAMFALKVSQLDFLLSRGAFMGWTFCAGGAILKMINRVFSPSVPKISIIHEQMIYH